MGPDELVERINDEGNALDSGNGFFESLSDPHQTVCVLYMVLSAIDNGGVIMGFAHEHALPFEYILEKLERIGCKEHAALLRQCLLLLSLAAEDSGAVIGKAVADNWQQALELLEPQNETWFSLPEVWARLAEWIVDSETRGASGV